MQGFADENVTLRVTLRVTHGGSLIIRMEKGASTMAGHLGNPGQDVRRGKLLAEITGYCRPHHKGRNEQGAAFPAAFSCAQASMSAHAPQEGGILRYHPL